MRLPNGFSLIEMMLVVGIMGVVTVMALFQIGSVRPYLKGDGAMRTVIAQMNTARELSISQRRNIQVTFIGNVITLTRQNIAVGTAPATTTDLAAIPMEGGVQFVATSGVANLPEWTGGGYATVASIFFSSDGSLIGATGLPVNEIVFMTIPNQARSLRAVTVAGPTGRIKGYKWDGGKWVSS
jgi:prepilin-type N-terminal cleavage/methylation domain-containing protein